MHAVGEGPPRQHRRHRAPPGGEQHRQHEQREGRQHDQRPRGQRRPGRRQRRADMARRAPDRGRDHRHRAHIVGPEPRRGGRDDQQRHDQHDPGHLQPDDGDQQRDAHHRHVDGGQRQALRLREAWIEADQRQRAAQREHRKARRRPGPGDGPCLRLQHPGGGAEEKPAQPRGLAPGQALNDGQQHDAEAEQHRQHRADRRVLGQPGEAHGAVHQHQPEARAERGAQQQTRQPAPVKAHGRHDQERRRRAGQGRVADGVGHQRAPAQ